MIGCRPIIATLIAEGIFDELNWLLNNLSDKIDFDLHYDISDCEDHIIANNEESNNLGYKRVHTMTISSTLFKFILNKYLERYKYTRPEYIKDFYIASDLVCIYLYL